MLNDSGGPEVGGGWEHVRDYRYELLHDPERAAVRQIQILSSKLPTTPLTENIQTHRNNKKLSAYIYQPVNLLS